MPEPLQKLYLDIGAQSNAAIGVQPLILPSPVTTQIEQIPVENYSSRIEVSNIVGD